MRISRVPPKARSRLWLLPVFALGLASAAPLAQAQGVPDKPAAASEPGAEASRPGDAAKPNSVDGVTVNASRGQAGGFGVPPDKAAAYTAEAAKAEAWRDYRKSTPPLTKDPNDQSKDFPGLQTYIPQ